MSYYCNLHGAYEEHWNGCPKCQVAEDHAREAEYDAEQRAREAADDAAMRAEELTEDLEDLAYRQSNPGQFKCPSCKYITLKRNASACPKCQRDVPTQYWTEVNQLIAKRAAEKRAQEAKQAEEAGAQRKRERLASAERERLAAAEKQAATEREAAAAQREEARQRRVHTHKLFWGGVAFLCTIGVAIWC
jgi:hypothetical protein